MDVNLNSANCLVTREHFGYTTVNNICRGTSTSVDWAIGEWGLFIFLLLFAIALLFICVAVIRETTYY